MSAPSNLAARGLFNSTIGAKIVMALTGFVLVGFVVQHMVANLQLYAGPDALNSYAAGLKGLGGGSVVWLGRAFLLACLGLHVAARSGTSTSSSMKLVNPANKRKYKVIVVGTGLAGARGRGHAGRARLQRRVLLLPGQPAPRALDRRAGRHQRREELPERRRQRLPPVLRHGQGRRLPRPRGQRLPPRRGQRSTSSTSASRRACPSRASTAACSTTAPSAARRCRARSTPAARPASSCCSAPTRR
jgi:hypothetical protein